MSARVISPLRAHRVNRRGLRIVLRQREAEAAEAGAAANNKANEKGADARKDAVSGKRDADFAVAKERCEAFAGDAKSNCLSEAKVRFGK